MRRTLDFKVKEARKGGRPKKTWLKAVIEKSRIVGLIKDDANNRSRWRIGVNIISSMRR